MYTEEVYGAADVYDIIGGMSTIIGERFLKNEIPLIERYEWSGLRGAC